MTYNYAVLHNLCDELRTEVVEHILPFWMHNVVDKKNGGFHGQILNNNTIVEDAPRSIILYSRILWTFSASYRILHKNRYRDIAEQAYNYIMNHFWDQVYGGVYWMVDNKGKVIEQKKHVYAQAFTIYGLSEFNRATSNTTALNRAMDLYHLLKKYSYQSDGTGYHEAFTRQWTPLNDVRLSDKDDAQQRSMNTHLHLFEAFANLYRAHQNDDLKNDLTALVQLFFGPIYNIENNHFYTFFDEKWNPTTDIYSYGHDIEAAWLLLDASRVLNKNEIIEKSQELILTLADVTLNEGVDQEVGGLFHTGCSGNAMDSDKHWWAQTEAIVGFVYAYKVSGNERYLEAADKIWEFVKKYMIDQRYGEWYFRVDRNGKPYMQEEKAGAWKCPYHNVRMGLELMEQVNLLKSTPGEQTIGTK